ncbi:TonB-linked SusC/RagA family outer membrane protein [Dyadobacter jejuensis]|uniref:TonB-linked SusC/RagA family outer membrane protein n=1 Tax=Dyadobacter jejuensis TaxID=1082580 RepID=A0A316AAL0_9BACT|nr:SusC/RagA family TonB-linked outer membrane protein [Dyadobacter jejuensis]PWJ53894.1 TonB-linked SusC/RagA family outer membrane protein [Dyadobacter jejuensis]
MKLLLRCRVLTLLLGSCCVPSLAQNHELAALDVKPGHNIRSEVTESKQTRVLTDVLKDLEKQYEVHFAYQKSAIINKRIKVTLEKCGKVEECLDDILTPLNLRYERFDNTYVIKEKPAEEKPVAKPVSQLTIVEEQAEIIVTGKVFAKEDGGPLPGVNVVVKGTMVGTSTDSDGKYSIAVPSTESILVFSYLGYSTQELPVLNHTTLDVYLPADTRILNEVMVTALGFKEVADKMASTSSKVTGESIGKSGEASIINGLAGKASGVQISGQGSDPGAGAFIQIRGQSTITGNTQPLIVIDGIPISNSTVGAGQGGVVQQSRLNDLNPNDIASVQILKGASAAALWGSRAANGVMIITTKQGKDSNKINISYSSTYSVDKINAFHPRQTTFGQGSGGVYSPTHANSWGDKIADRAGGEDQVNTSGAFFQAQDGTKYYPIVEKNSREVYTDDNFNQVFGAGHFWDNSLSLSGGNAKSTYFFSAGNLSQKGILQGNSQYRRTTLRLNVSKTFNDYIKITNNVGFTNSSSNRVQRGNNTAGAMLGLLRTPPDFDISDYKGSYYSNANAAPIENRQRSYRRYLGNTASPIYSNPLWPLNEQTNTSQVNRFINSFEMNIKPMVEWFDLTTRLGIDHYTDQRLAYFPINDTPGSGAGSFTENIVTENEVNLDVIGRATHTFGPNLSGTLIGGFNVNDRKFFNIGGSLSNFLIADAPVTFNNSTATNRSPFNDRSHIRVARFYSTANIAAFDALFVNASIAGESASTFGNLSDKTFFYPSTDAAWQFTQLNALKNLNFLTFGKLRASYGVVGVQPLPYRSNTTYVASSFSNGPWGDNLDGANYGEGAFLLNTELGDPRLKPERKTEYELGTDLRFFNNKLRLNFTYYHNKITDMLIPVTLAPSVGYASSYTNAASMENKGVELDMFYSILKKGDWTVSVNANFNRNKNQVLNLAGTESLYLTGRADRADMRAVQGHQAGVFWGGQFERASNGSLVMNENNFPVVSPSLGVIGDPNPDWRGGFGTSVTYKNFNLDLLFETFQGGDFASLTKGVMYTFGTHADVGKEVTLTEDLKNYAGQTIPAGSTVRGNLHDFGGGTVLLDESFYTTLGSGLGSVAEQFIEDASWTRLRQATLGYTLRSEGFRKKTGLQSMELSITGRNLLLWTKLVGIDPDTNFTGNYYGRGYDYFNNPANRSMLFTIKVNY